jgi:hypothetical protein
MLAPPQYGQLFPSSDSNLNPQSVHTKPTIFYSKTPISTTKRGYLNLMSEIYQLFSTILILNFSSPGL